ncbi:UNVERIFIED_CONTAM: hypothetical protein FKN15_048675 [Acipenser sinensis]
MEDDDSLYLQYDMNDCYSRLKRLVPTIPRDKKVSRVEILQHVIDYILDLQFALEANPVLLSQQHGNCPSANRRSPLSALNTDQVCRKQIQGQKMLEGNLRPNQREGMHQT